MKKLFTLLLISLWITTGYSQYIDEDFDSGIPATWSTSSESDANPWFYDDGTTTQNLDGTGYARADSDAAGSGTIDLIENLDSPGFDASGGNIVIVQFDQFFNELGNDEAILQVWDGTIWNTAWSHTDDDLGAWGAPDNKTVIITDYVNPSGDTKIRFRYLDGGSWAWYWAVDNVVVSSVDCLEPMDITITEGAVESIIEWSSGSGDSDLLWGAAGFDTSSTGTLVTDLTSPYVLEGLSPSTSYDVYIKDDCGLDGESAYVGPVTFTTTEACPDPYMQYNPFTNVSSFSTDFVYTQNGIGDVYMILGPNGFVLGDVASDTILMTGSPFALTGLEADSTYTAYLYMDCEQNPADSLGLSSTIGPKSFTTLPACPQPYISSYSGFTNETTSTVDVAYTNYGTGDIYLVYGPEGFLPGDVASDTVLLDTNPYTLTGLSPLTFYDGYIYMDCSADGYGTSENSSTTASFNTLTDAAGTSCGDPFVLSSANLPYTSVAQSICGYGNNVTSSPCNYAGYEEIIFAYSPETEGELLGVYMTNFTTGTIYLDITEMCPDSADATCVTSAYVSTSSNETFLLTTDGIDLEVGTVYYIMISAYTYSGCTLDLQIFLIDCTTPTNLTSTSYADSTVLSWDLVNDSSANWQVVWGPEGFDLATEGTTVDGNYNDGSGTTTITGLSDTTSYDFYVLDMCGLNNVSIPAGPASFVGPPPTNDFCSNAITIECGDMLVGSTITASDSTNTESSCNGYSYAQGATVWYTFVGTGDEIAITTCGTGWNTALYVYTGDCGDSLECNAYNAGNYWLGEYQCTGDYTTDSYVSINSEAGVTYTIAVTAGTTYQPPTGQFNLSMECIPCSNPYDLDVLTVSNEAALLNWTSLNPSANYSYEYGLVDFIPGSGSGSGSGVIEDVDAPVSSSLTISGLLANEEYTFYIIEECTEGSSDTLWVDFMTNEFAPPANDLCSNAAVIACGESDTSQTTYATSFGNPMGGLCGGDYNLMDQNTVWWQFVGTGQEMNLSTCGSYRYGPYNSYYAELFILTGDCDSLNCMEYSSYNSVPGCPIYGSTNVSIYGELGVTYYVAVQPNSSYYADGEAVLTLECIECSNPEGISATVTDVTASINWSSFNSPIDFTMYWDSTGIIDLPSVITNTVTGNTSTDLPIALTGLVADVTYELFIIEHCTDTTTSDTIHYTFTTNALPPPSNDAACDAIALTAGDTLATTNIYSSVETGEVEPPLTSYTDPNQMGWGYLGLDATTWYTFTPSMTGTVNISTCHVGGYDTQLAVYEVEDCADFSTYTLIRANDDQIGGCSAATYASTVDDFCLTAGVTYYIQVDPFSHSNIGQDFSISVDFIGAEVTNGIAFPGIHSATLNFDYFSDLGGDTDYTLIYSSATTSDTITGNTADLPVDIDGLDDDTEYEFFVTCNDDCGTVSSAYVFTTIFDGISTLDFGDNVSVYPNPSSDKITVEINAEVNAGSMISIVNMQGKVLYQETVKDNRSDYTTEIDVNNFARGIYLLKLEDDNSSIQQRIIVQ